MAIALIAGSFFSFIFTYFFIKFSFPCLLLLSSFEGLRVILADLRSRFLKLSGEVGGDERLHHLFGAL